jgi:hypothetical protein
MATKIPRPLRMAHAIPARTVAQNAAMMATPITESAVFPNMDIAQEMATVGANASGDDEHNKAGVAGAERRIAGPAVLRNSRIMTKLLAFGKSAT